jgi:hypothetical protein
MSDASMESSAAATSVHENNGQGTTTIVQTSTVNNKIARPDLFSGERKNLESFILQWDLYFRIEGEKVKPEDRALLVTSYFRGAAQTWLMPYLQKFFGKKADADTQQMFHDYDYFKEKLRETFGLANEPAIAERAIQGLRQKNSASDYANTFQRYSIQTEWNDAALMRMYRQGLKPSVRIELLRSGMDISNLTTLINESIRIDNDLHEFKLESLSYTGTKEPRKEKYAPNQGHRRSKNTKRVRGYYPSHGTVEMDIDNMQIQPVKDNKAGRGSSYKGKGGNDKSQKETRTCYNCNKPGHISRDCRQKKNTVIRELNVLTHTPDSNSEDDEQWTVISNQLAADTLMGMLNNKVRDMGLTEQYNTLAPAEREELEKKVHFEMHPGEKVTTVWDFEDPASNADGDEQLTPEKLAIHTPPASPKLVRSNATVGQLPEQCKTPIECKAALGKEEYRRRTQEWENAVRWQMSPEKAEKLINRQRRLDEETEQNSQALHPDPNSEWNRKVQEEYPAEQAAGMIQRQRDLNKYSDEFVQKYAEIKARRAKQEKYANDGQALILDDELVKYDVPHTWSPKINREYEEKKAAKTENPTDRPLSRVPQYQRDPRNLNHWSTTWSSCFYDDCMIHESEKIGAGWYPQQRNKCKWQWFDCPKDTCERHLWDKREAKHFPDVTDEDKISNQVLINQQCLNMRWQFCLQNACIKCKDAKILNGFLPRTTESAPFLGQRPAPGISPEVAMQLTRAHSSSSTSKSTE